eukprot:jgi/Chrzof1/7275/Cz02g17140.t1
MDMSLQSKTRETWNLAYSVTSQAATKPPCMLNIGMTSLLHVQVLRSFPRNIDPATVKHSQVCRLVEKILQHAATQHTAQSHNTSQQHCSHQQQVESQLNPTNITTTSWPSTSTDGHDKGGSHRFAKGPLPTAATSDSTKHNNHKDKGLVDAPDSAASWDMQREVNSVSTTSSSTAGNLAGGSSSRTSSPPPPPTKEKSIFNALDSLDEELADLGGTAGKTVGQTTSSADVLHKLSTTGKPSKSQLQLSSAAHGAGAALKSLTAGGAATSGAAADDCLVLEPSYDGTVDLNKVSDYELKLAKAQMDQQYLQHLLRPGDPAYVYDKQVEFAPGNQHNDWDDDDDDDDDVF